MYDVLVLESCSSSLSVRCLHAPLSGSLHGIPWNSTRELMQRLGGGTTGAAELSHLPGAAQPCPEPGLPRPWCAGLGCHCEEAQGKGSSSRACASLCVSLTQNCLSTR